MFTVPPTPGGCNSYFAPSSAPGLPQLQVLFFLSVSAFAHTVLLPDLLPDTEGGREQGPTAGSWPGRLGFICSSYIDFILVSKAMNDLKAGFC